MIKGFIHNLQKGLFARVVINIIILSVLASPFISYALPPSDGLSPDSGSKTTLENPLRGSGVDSVNGLIGKLLDIVIEFGVPLAALVLVYTGYTFVTSMGDPKKLDLAKEMFWWTVIGTALVVGAKAIWSILQNTISGITG